MERLGRTQTIDGGLIMFSFWSSFDPLLQRSFRASFLRALLLDVLPRVKRLRVWSDAVILTSLLARFPSSVNGGEAVGSGLRGVLRNLLSSLLAMRLFLEWRLSDWTHPSRTTLVLCNHGSSTYCHLPLACSKTQV